MARPPSFPFAKSGVSRADTADRKLSAAELLLERAREHRELAAQAGDEKERAEHESRALALVEEAEALASDARSSIRSLRR